MPFSYPIALELSGRRCVVVGGGEVAEHKVGALLEAGAEVTVIADRVQPGLRRLSEEGRIRLTERRYLPGDLAGAFLAIAATGSPEVHAQVFEEAERERVLLNAVDDPSRCHFAVPAIVRRDDFLVAISTGGKAPALAKRIRRELAGRFGPEVGALVDLLGQVREEALATRNVDFPTWARRWARAVDRDLAALVREGREQEVRDWVRGCLAGEGGEAEGRVAIVGAGPGDPELITLRGRRLVEEADVVVHDRLVHPSLYAGKVSVDAGKEPGGRTVPQEATTALLVRLARQGRRVVRLKGGDPFVFGRGAEEAEALAAAGIPFEVVPAPTSAVAAAAYAGIPVTDRRHASSVLVVTGRSAPGREGDWGRVAGAADTIVVLMGLARLPEIVAGLLEGGLDPATPAAIVENGTLPSQRVVTCGLAELPMAARRHGIGPPAIVVVGEVVRLRDAIAWFPEAPGAGAGPAPVQTGTSILDGRAAPSGA